MGLFTSHTGALTLESVHILIVDCIESVDTVPLGGNVHWRTRTGINVTSMYDPSYYVQKAYDNNISEYKIFIKNFQNFFKLF